jgi:hypothetical protein
MKYFDERIPWADKPDTCDICKGPIIHSFVNGLTRSGTYAIMCPACHLREGVGLSPVLGQLYEERNAGDFVKLVG